MIQVDQCFSALLWRYGMRLSGCRCLCRHIAPDPARDVVPCYFSHTIERAALGTETDSPAHS